ncbi:MAG TPA: PQQ-binding-like beta-propeller repeat protein [Solirubrobacterales bacterium]|jgi:outer membrane protein assembly factor BamB|nr:PQQ-binding-like beta-propeller repeat protein [Solirubrobacterales bacterium]
MSSRFPRRVVLLLTVLAGAVALGGCGGSGRPNGNGDVNASSSNSGLVSWPLFGRVPERTHYLPAPPRRALDPPLREAWSINTHALIEFPPAIAGGIAYVVNKYGNAKAVRLRDRKILWERNTNPKDSGTPTDVTGPVYHQGNVFFAYVDGDLVAVDARSGKQVWTRKLAGHLESSPMAVGGTLYLGTDKTNVVAVRASDGKVLWQFNSPAAIKASPSFHRGRIFVADYESGIFCLDASDGKLLWRTNTSKVPPFGEGGFYSSPAIAFGRVYAGRDDGTVLALDEKTGEVDWSFPTNNFVYGSPAVARVPGTPPTVYIGSYDEHFYALDALTGKQRWRYDVGGPVPGTATVIGHTVYTSSFKTREAIGIDVRSHRKTFELKQAGYTPMVSDGRRLYLIGYYELIGLRPTQP